ncbi:MAG TPA: ATP-grasp domain-containing protein [Verrucomicrobiae bacterium]|jgi:predicted ATP-grasp superfamily ATP-dependent carboligase|nr:ATP-grasp domain-containing protein [Verrucomicrobiae bacterium]
MSRLLLFTAKLGYQTRSFDEAARKLGVDLVFVTDRCHQLDDPWGDRAIPVHFESPDAAAYAVLEAVRGQNVDGILTLGDRPTVAASYVARGLGILYNHPAAVEACRSKLRMREVSRETGLRVPWFRSISLTPTPEPSLLGIVYPCVAKPLSLSASQGVFRANSREEFMAAAARIRCLLESPEIRATREPNLDQILVEGYIPGREVAVEGLLTDGQLRVLAIFDKPDPLEGPYFEETIYVTPSRLADWQQREIERCAVDAIRALGLSQGPVHAEFRINEEGVWPLEVAPRPIGGLCGRALRFAPDAASQTIGFEELLLRHALGLPGRDWLREPSASGVMMIPVLKSGILEKVEGEDAARSVPGITALEITARLHDYIAAWPEGSSYLGFLFATGNSAAEVEEAIRKAHAKLYFELRPRLPVEHPSTGRFPVAGD